MFGNRILLLIPHPDDEIVGCATAIRRALAQGSQIYGYYLTQGIPDRRTFWPWARHRYAERLTRRRREMQEAAEQLQIRVCHWQQIPSRQLKAHIESTITRIKTTITTIAADCLWVPAYEGGHQDHDTANFIASRLQNDVPVWEFSEYHYARAKVRTQDFILYNGSERIVELTPQESEIKQQLLRIYQSEQGNLDYVNTMQEIFRPLARYDYSNPPHAGTLFYQRFQWVPYHPRIDYCKPNEVSAAIQKYFVEYWG